MTMPLGGSGSDGGRASYIAPGIKFKGEISGSAEVVVDGEVEGRVEIQAAVKVGPKGSVLGDIKATSVEVSGKVVGNVRSRERFELQSSGRIEGDVTSPRVIIAEGSYFKGNVEMTGGVGSD